MTTELTEKPTTAPETPGTHGHDAAPSPLANRTMGTPDVAMPSQDFVRLEPTKRQKTYGEKRFDWVTYGGIALAGNEATSFGITESIKEGRFAHKAYQKFEGLFTRMQKPGTTSWLREYAFGTAEKPGARLPFLLVATLGGMLMVPFIKHREDHKGEIVRKLDRKHYGAAADHDPQLEAAHKEMDDAPKQSWSSLGKGRVTTVASAAVADFVFGWPEALTTKIFKDDSPWKKYSSLERFAGQVAEGSTTLLHKQFNLSEGAQNSARKAIANGTWLLTLSASLTVLFYASSKLFATRQDEKQHQRTGSVHTENGDIADMSAEQRTAKVPALLTQSDAPGTHVSAIERQSLLMPQQGLQMN